MSTHRVTLWILLANLIIALVGLGACTDEPVGDDDTETGDDDDAGDDDDGDDDDGDDDTDEVVVATWDDFVLLQMEVLCQLMDVCGWLTRFDMTYVECLEMDPDMMLSGLGPDCLEYFPDLGAQCITAQYDLISAYEADGCPEDWMEELPPVCDEVCTWGE